MTRLYYCIKCAEHYDGGKTCPDCGTEGRLA